MKIQEKQYGFEVQDLCIIRLSRYAYSSLHRYAERFNNGRSGAAKSARQDYDQFYLLDYFDGLTYQKDKYGTLQFENCMGLEVPSLEGILHHKKNNTTAIQSWSLVRLKSDSTYFSDPFLYQSKDPAHLSDKPFLAIIAVTINPEHYYMWTKHHPNKSARGFIQECLESIERRVR